ncbi:hypothetical protein OBBRIDRAFT_888764 [Obba rivulosa]|uniref:DUF6534 domain-containing protein n=1 Tax=Obba rivulosa TaxID=1052685 RepID=A0A8E2DI38_9APHY|nr:hypothetical protein OBBRIDRAFT_888764 [Obba rivulosa]
MSSSSMSHETIHDLIIPDCGARLLAMVLSAVFYGITILQTYSYYDGYWNDTFATKSFVAILTILDTAHMASIIESNWFYVIANYGDPDSVLGTFALGTPVEIIANVAIAFLVQSFFARRVWLTNDRLRIIPMMIVALSLTQFALGIYYGSSVRPHHDITVVSHLAWVAVASSSCGISADFLITALLCYNLHRYRTGAKRANKLINRLMVYTVNTGLLTSIAAAFTIILSNVYPTALWSKIPFCIATKLYVNSALAVLNTRKGLRNMSATISASTAVSSSVKLEFTEVNLGGGVTVPSQEHRNREQTSPSDSHAANGGDIDIEAGIL